MNQRGFWKLDDVSDERLVGNLKELLVADARTEARIVAHLAELDARRLHLKLEQSLFQYCQKRLGLSDNQAYYRIAAARVARQFPVVFGMLERREIHLTNIAPLSKCLTEENHVELLREAGSLSKRELLMSLARRAPRPDVPSQIRRLSPRAGAVAAGPTGSLEPLSETSYRLQLNTSPALKEKLELARDLMSHANRSGDLAIVVERGLDLLIEKLQKQRFGLTSRPRRRGREGHSANSAAASTNASASTMETARPSTGAQTLAETPRETEGHSTAPVAARRSDAPAVAPSASETARVSVSADLRGARRFDRSKRGRSEGRAHIPNETRRGLVERDGLCCSYVGDDGQRCTARAFLQIDHEKPWAKAGLDTLDNLRLLCAAHNQLRAEQEYGANHMRRAIERETEEARQQPLSRSSSALPLPVKVKM